MALSGELGSLSFAALFTALKLDGRTGTLTVESGSGSRQVIIRQGRLLSASLLADRDFLLNDLAQRNLIDPAQLEPLKTDSKNTFHTVAEKLLQTHWITSQQLVEVQQRYLETTIIDLLKLENGNFRFADSPVTSKNLITFERTGRRFLEQGLNHPDTLIAITDALADLDQFLCLVSGPELLSRQVELEQSDLFALARVNNVTTFRKILSVLDDADMLSLAERYARLIERGLVRTSFIPADTSVNPDTLSGSSALYLSLLAGIQGYLERDVGLKNQFAESLHILREDLSQELIETERGLLELSAEEISFDEPSHDASSEVASALPEIADHQSADAFSYVGDEGLQEREDLSSGMDADSLSTGGRFLETDGEAFPWFTTLDQESAAVKAVPSEPAPDIPPSESQAPAPVSQASGSDENLRMDLYSWAKGANAPAAEMSRETGDQQEATVTQPPPSTRAQKPFASPGATPPPPLDQQFLQTTPAPQPFMAIPGSGKTPTMSDDEDSMFESDLREAQVAKRVRYKKFVSEVTMTFNRLTMRQLNHFQVLGVDITATSTQIKRAYDRFRKSYDPTSILRDNEKDNEIRAKALEIIRRATLAFNTLIDPKSRKEYMASIKSRRQEIEQRKQNSLLLFNECMALYKDGKYEDARNVLKKAMAFDSNNPVFYNMLETLDSSEKTTESERYFKAGVLTFTKRNDLDRAVLLIRKSIQMNSRLDYLMKLGEILATERSRRSEALEVYKTALLMDPGNSGLLLEMGKLALALNKRQDALDYFHETLRWDEDSLEAKKYQNELMAEGLKPTVEEEKDRKKSGRK